MTSALVSRQDAVWCRVRACPPCAHLRLIIFRIFLRFAWLRLRSRVCAWDNSQSRRFSIHDIVESIRKITKWHRRRHRLCCHWSSLYHESRQPAPARMIIWRWRRQVLLSHGVWFLRRAPQWRPASASAIIFIVGAAYKLVPCVIFSRHYFSQSATARAAPVAGCQHRRGSMFLRILRRSCWSENDARRPSIPQRRMGWGVKRARIDLLLVVRVLVLENQMSAISQAARIPGVPLVGHTDPVSTAELHPRLHRLPYLRGGRK